MKKVVRNVLIVLVLFVGVTFVTGCKASQEKKLNKYLKELGNAYYEKYYSLFDDEAARSEFLARYSTLGIKVDLENLARTVSDTKDFPSKDEILKKFVNNKTKEACNSAKTKITIYPQKPFGNKDYKIEVNLDCGFKK